MMYIISLARFSTSTGMTKTDTMAQCGTARRRADARESARERETTRAEASGGARRGAALSRIETRHTAPQQA